MMSPEKPAIKLAQRLANDLEVDGWIGPRSKARFKEILGIELPKNRLVAGVIQRATFSQFTKPPTVKQLKLDYWYGPDTDTAVEAWWHYIEDRSLPVRRDEQPDGCLSERPKSICSKPTDARMIKEYGKPGKNQKTFNLPYPVRLAWDTATIVTRMTLHESVYSRAVMALIDIGKSYDRDERDRLGLNLYGGALNVRKKRGGSTWSAHAFGAAIDWDPDHNRLRWKSDKAKMAGPEYKRFIDIWEENGFMNLGRCYDFDWMHYQANP